MLKRSVRTATLLCGLLLCAATQSSPAQAQSAVDVETARRLMDEGRQKEAAKDFAGALEAYRAAHEIMKVSTTGLSVAKAQIAMVQLVEARVTALSIAHAPPQPGEHAVLAEARAEATRLADELAERIPTVKLVVPGVTAADVTVNIDGKQLPKAASLVPIPLNPGKHAVRVTAPGNRSAFQVVDVKERERRELTMALGGQAPGTGPTDAESHKPTPWLTYIGFSVGGAGLLAGTITGAMSMSKTSSAKEQCDGNRCPPAAQGDIDSADTLGTVSNITFGIGLVGVAVGVYGLMSEGSGTEAQPGSSSAVRISPAIGLGSVGVTGAF